MAKYLNFFKNPFNEQSINRYHPACASYLGGNLIPHSSWTLTGQTCDDKE